MTGPPKEGDLWTDTETPDKFIMKLKTKPWELVVRTLENLRFNISMLKKIIVCAKLYISEVLIDFVTSTITVVGSTSNRY